ncbi:MAG TPA: HEAT repeat domain-containing protein, partial [Ktedonobacteraceae bacterium]|nr:HEAT repeat domain-containing protein [Ktedonobacteraceae bacterium]
REEPDAYIIHEFGEELFTEALPEIASYLTSTDERVRYMALHVLNFHFRSKDYKYAAINMLQDDPDEECREQAAGGLGSLMKNTGDRESLHVLAQVVRNEQEGNLIRALAYSSMRAIVHDDRKEQDELIGNFDAYRANWDFVDSYQEG